MRKTAMAKKLPILITRSHMCTQSLTMLSVTPSFMYP
jgi:hypothetical protein